MLKNSLLVGTMSIASVLMTGCVTMRESRIPEFMEELNKHEFSPEQKETIGEILHYVNELENQ